MKVWLEENLLRRHTWPRWDRSLTDKTESRSELAVSGLKPSEFGNGKFGSHEGLWDRSRDEV